MSIEDWNTRPIEDHLRSVIREAAAKLAGRPTNGNADIFNSLIADVFCDLCLEVDTWEATNGNDSDKPTNT